jgi:division protein CdvB (Snf7/Vps24/ESCRT-III family)
MSFEKKWVDSNEDSTLDKVRGAIKPSDPLKSRLDASIKRIELENQRLEQASVRFQARDKMMFEKVVEAYSKHDTASSNVYANELAEIRKMERMILQAKLSLEQIALRMRTVTELGDVAVTLLPVVSTISDVKSGMASINPQAEKQLGEIGDLLNGIVVDASIISGMSINFDSLGEDSTKILVEAQTVAESKMNETFPELPNGKLHSKVSSSNDFRENSV